ncbi:MAG: hypothetical protein CVV10_05665 [Gammaproteobacteria bacterium HGW-Gammaproteobacteria-14]|nr:MAG: hypothetical protein CVV10_05665 [Gammaproteobacteria bacterium HGW-Gammaproteobacteria-14]
MFLLSQQKSVNVLFSLRVAGLAVLLLGLQGCAVSRIGDNLPYGVLNHTDITLVGEGMPTYLLTIDGLIENWPDSESLLQSGASLYSAYAGLFVDDPQRASQLSSRALDYALRAACASDRKLCDIRRMPMVDFEELLARQKRKQVPVLFTLGTTWAGYIQLNSSDWNAVADLGRVDALMQRVVALDEGYEHGQAHMYLGVLNSILPESLGGKPEVARQHFERAVELSNGRNLMAQTLFAERYARLVFDQALHDSLLDEVLAANPIEHGLTLQNTVAQRDARVLRNGSADYFE